MIKVLVVESAKANRLVSVMSLNALEMNFSNESRFHCELSFYVYEMNWEETEMEKQCSSIVVLILRLNANCAHGWKEARKEQRLNVS